MKSILMSIKPQWVAKILNGEKTIEIRKKFPKDYVGWVYIYNTKDTKNGYLKLIYVGSKLQFVLSWTPHVKYRGKVVARFWCDKVEEIENKPFTRYGYPRTKTLDSYDLAKHSCVDNCDIKEYLDGGIGYAIHITKLEIFNKPKEISEFFTAMGLHKPSYMLEKAPQSWCYIEI